MPTPLLQALYQRQSSEVSRLLAATPSVNIFEAAALGDAARLRALLREDPQLVYAKADDGFHPLHLAAYFGRLEVGKILLEGGADANAVAANPSRVRPLHSAISGHHLDLLRLLLEAGADPNAQQQGGWTALHSAYHQGNTEAIRLLLDHRADPSIKSDDGRTPAEMAL